MPDKGLAPRVEDAQEADRGAQVSRVGGDFEEGGGARAEEEVIEQRAIAAAQGLERVRQREDHVDVRDGKQLALPRGEPAFPGLRLALRTVPVATRVVRDRPMPAGTTLIEMAAQCRGPTPLERAQDSALLHAQPRMPLEEVITLRVEDIGHLHGGPAHGCTGLRKIRE